MFRDERPPRISSPGDSSGSDLRRWIPPSSQKRNVVNTEDRDVIFRRVRGILNKLTPEKFDKLSLELLNIGIESKYILKGIILLIFDKALDEPKYSKLYAQLCHRLCEDSPNFEASSSKITSFKRLLLNKCQDEFENRSRIFEAFDKDELTPDEQEQFHIAKHKMLGNIKFIGELGKLDMLHEGILHRCIQQLLEKKTKTQTIQDMGEDFECLCQILRTVGRAMDHDKARLWMDQYFDRISTVMMHPDLPARIRFMLLDIVELRDNQWGPRLTHDFGPKTIQQVREEAIKEYGYLPLPNSAMANLTMNMDPFGRPMNGTITPHKSTMGDIFGPVSPPFMGSSSIGTGPGVVDDFTPSFLNSKPGKTFDPGFSGPYVSNRGKPNDRRGGHNSPRFDRFSNQPTYHREKEADNDSDDDYSHSNERQSNRDNNHSNNRFNRDSDRQQQQQQPNRYNRNQQNLNVNYRNQENRGYQPRQRSPYNQEEDRGKDNRSPDDNWRKDKVEEPRGEKPKEKRAYRPGIDNIEKAPSPRSNRDERPRRDDWDDKDRVERRDERKEETNRDIREPIKREDRKFGSREDVDRSPGKPNKESFDYGRSNREVQKSRDQTWERGTRSFDDDREDNREKKNCANGDIRDQRDQDRFERGREQDRDYRSNRDVNADFRGNNRDPRDFRDFRENRDFRDNRGGFNRDFDSRGGSGFGGTRQPQKDNQPAARELPPRFQRKQQQQQGQVDLFPSEVPSPTTLDGSPPVSSQTPPQGMPPGGPPQRYRHPLMANQRPPMPGFFPPRYPPPGGPPMRGPPPRGYPGQPPIGMPPHPRFTMGGGQQNMDNMRDQPTPGGPGQSPTQNLPKGPAKPDEISLRPARNFPTLLRPSAPSMLPMSAQNPHLGPSQLQQMVTNDILGPAPGGPQPSMKPTNLTIKQVPAPERKDKRKLPNKEELRQATDEFIKSFIETADLDKAVNTVKDMKPPRRFMPEMISIMIVYGLERGDADRENINQLIFNMKQERVLSSDLYLDGLTIVLERMSELEQEIPLVKSNVAKFAAQAVGNNIISLADLSEPLLNGAHYPFFLLCLQQLHKVKDKDWLIAAFTESKIELLCMLPECDRTKERMVEILEDRSLSFLFPLLRVQSDLWRQIRSDPNPTNLYKWIKENVDVGLQADHGFIEILVTNVLRYITSESTLADGLDPNNPEKAAIDKEKDMTEKYKGVLQRFLLDKMELQMVAIYAIQVLGYSRQFPKGMMLRMFMYMYDLEVIDEETFLKWKEEVNDEFPGKGQVLFQVHQWLTWLEQAEEEESDDDN